MSSRHLMEYSLFSASKLRQSIAEIEFRYFRSRAEEEIAAIVASTNRFSNVRDAFSFWVDRSGGDDHLQLNFGTRKMGVLDLQDKQGVTETGPKLVYSLGRTGGVVATVLYPAKSALGSVAEDHIFLRVGSYSGSSLLGFLRSDIRDLIGYTFISSLETDPTLRDRLRFWWLRKTRPQQIGGELVHPVPPSKMLATGFKFAVTSFLIAIFRPLGNLLFYLLLLYLGYTYLLPNIR